MNSPVLFSIIVPTYNRAYLITATIESVLAQTYQHFELIIVDDGSTDNTEEVVERYLSDKIHYYKKTNAERAAARNYGTLKSKGDYINWFDSDDIMFSDHLECAANLIFRYNWPEIIAQNYQYQSISGNILNSSAHSLNIGQAMYKGNPFANSPVIVRRDIAIGNPYNEDKELSGSEDYELWLRIASKYQIYTSPEITVGFVHHDNRSTITMRDQSQLINRYTKLIHYATSDIDVLKFLGKYKDFFEMKTYLLLAIDLVISGYFVSGTKYIIKAFVCSPKVIFERGFLAFIKHSLRFRF